MRGHWGDARGRRPAIRPSRRTGRPTPRGLPRLVASRPAQLLQLLERAVDGELGHVGEGQLVLDGVAGAESLGAGLVAGPMLAELAGEHGAPVAVGDGDRRIMAALGQMEHEIKRERVVDLTAKRRAAGKDLGGRPRIITNSQIRNARRLIEGGETAAQVALDLGMSRAIFHRRARALGLLPDQSNGQTLTSDNVEF